MSRPFLYDRRESFYDQQDYAPDHRYALMRYSGHPTLADDLHEVLSRIRFTFFIRKDRARPDRKRQKKGHRS
jgi:hypothetical protein